MGQDAGEGGGDNLVGFSGDSDRWWDADEEQKRCHQKAAANAKHTRQNADHAAQPKEQEGIYRNLGNRKVDLHGRVLQTQMLLMPAISTFRGVMSNPSAKIFLHLQHFPARWMDRAGETGLYYRSFT